MNDDKTKIRFYFTDLLDDLFSTQEERDDDKA